MYAAYKFISYDAALMYKMTSIANIMALSICEVGKTIKSMNNTIVAISIYVP
jgi:hypothetical protein